MSKATRYLPLASCALALALPARAQMDPATFVTLGASVLKVEVVKQGGGYSLGSGVVVGLDKVVTNCHVTREAQEIRVIKGGARWTAAAQSVDAERDVCLLRVPGIVTDAVRLGSAANLKLGQLLTAIGYTGGTGRSNSQGTIVALHRHDGARVIQTSNWFNSGASGGGLFDDKLQLVGILTFRLRGGLAHYFAAPVDWVRERLDDEARFQKVGPLDRRLPFWQKPIEEQPNFLQAIVLEQAGNWPALEALAGRWSASDASDFEPWYLRGVALAEQQRFEAAREALERAVALEPDAAQAWFRLGAVCHRLGKRERALNSLERLKALDGELAERLTKVLELA